jgi:hypothetical protein
LACFYYPFAAAVSDLDIVPQAGLATAYHNQSFLISSRQLLAVAATASPLPFVGASYQQQFNGILSTVTGSGAIHSGSPAVGGHVVIFALLLAVSVPLVSSCLLACSMPTLNFDMQLNHRLRAVLVTLVAAALSAVFNCGHTHHRPAILMALALLNAVATVPARGNTWLPGSAIVGTASMVTFTVPHCPIWMPPNSASLMSDCYRHFPAWDPPTMYYDLSQLPLGNDWHATACVNVAAGSPVNTLTRTVS